MLRKLFPMLFIAKKDRRRIEAIKHLDQASELEPALKPFIEEIKARVLSGRLYNVVELEEVERRRRGRNSKK